MNTQHLDDFKKYMEFERQRASATIHNYLSYATKLGSFIEKDFVHTSRENIRDFLADLSRQGHSKAGISNYIVALRCFFNWLADTTRRQEIIQLSFFLLKIIKIKREKNIPTVPTPEEIAKLRKTFDNFKKAAKLTPHLAVFNKILREIAAIELLIGTGVRSNELRNLRFGDVDLENKIIYIKKGKGDKQRVSIFNGTASKALKEYFENSRFENADLIFNYKQGNLINYLIKRWTKQAEINPKLHAHSFRHYFITQSQRLGVDIEIVAQQVGHSNLNSTRHYTHFSADDLREKFKDCNI